MIKKTSKVDSEEDHNNHNRKISGLAALDDDESGEQRDVVIGKVDSEYEQFMDRNSAFSQTSKAAVRNKNS